MERRITTKDIARELELNPSTVSRALHNHPQIAAATKKAVREAASRMGYHEDPSLKSLISYRWDPEKKKALTQIALILESVEPGDLHAAEHEAIERGKQRAIDLGYAIETFSLSAYKDPATLSKILFNRGISGVLIGRTRRSHVPENFFFDWRKFAAVAVDAGATTFLCHNVLANQVCSTGRLLRTLRAKGYRRIGAVLQNDQTRRLHAHEIGSFGYGQFIMPEAERIPPCFAHPLDHPDQIMDWVKRHQPDVVISRHEATLDVLRSSGLRVPEDLHFATLEKTNNQNRTAGFEYVKSCYAEAVVQLDTLLRLNCLGIPSQRFVLLLDPPWCPGDTLPGIETLQV